MDHLWRVLTHVNVTMVINLYLIYVKKEEVNYIVNFYLLQCDTLFIVF